MKVKPDTPSTYHAIAGIDWGDRSHAISLRIDDQPLEQIMLPSTPEKVEQWLAEIHQRTGGQPIAVALEMGKGALIEQLQEHEYVDIYALNPATTSYLRKAFKPSLAKDDFPDSLLHLGTLERHWDQLRLFTPRTGLDKRLHLLTQQRRNLRDELTGVTNKLRDCLKAYYPAALDAVGELGSKMANAFLKKWPSLAQLKRARPETLAKFYRASGSRSSERIQERLEKIRQAQAPSNDVDLLEPMSAYMSALVAQIEVLNEQEDKFHQLIEKAYAEHPDKAIWSSFPGAGLALAPRLAAAWGIDRERYQSAHQMQLYSATAPVTEKSGNAEARIHRRWSKPKFMHQTFWEYANQSTMFCDWAKVFVNAQIAQGKTRSTAIRALAFKWQRIMYACWQAGECYDEAKYESALAKRGSKFAKAQRSKSGSNGD